MTHACTTAWPASGQGAQLSQNFFLPLPTQTSPRTAGNAIAALRASGEVEPTGLSDVASVRPYHEKLAKAMRSWYIHKNDQRGKQIIRLPIIGANQALS